jgi:hypothetical protein
MYFLSVFLCMTNLSLFTFRYICSLCISTLTLLYKSYMFHLISVCTISFILPSLSHSLLFLYSVYSQNYLHSQLSFCNLNHFLHILQEYLLIHIHIFFIILIQFSQICFHVKCCLHVLSEIRELFPFDELPPIESFTRTSYFLLCTFCCVICSINV